MTELTTRRLDLAGTRDFAMPGAGAIRRRALARFGHDWLAGVWRAAVAGRRVDGVALAAVGSLARGDEGPLSDYDLVLVHHPRGLSGDAVPALADRLWYPIWDAGVRLDHSVRTVTECRSAAAADLTVAIGLLDLTHVAGDADVVAAARATVAHDWRARVRTRLPELAEAIAARHARHGDLAQLVEPDLKEARGGLRDMSVLRALAAGWLTDRPHGEVDRAHEHLLDVRDAIHVVSGRGRDRLTRQDQDAVAALLGYPDADELLTRVATSARTIGYAAHTTLRRAAQSQRARVLRVGPRRPQLVSLGHGLYEHDGEAVLGPSADPGADPLLALRAAVGAARAGLPLAPTTVRNLAARSAPLPEPWPRLARELFADLLASGPGVVAVWEALDLGGLVQRWIPEWTAVRSRPQRSPVHRHTVDRHLIEAVLVASGLAREVTRPDLLVLAALLHDLGKVPGAVDHCEAGARVAARVVRRMGLPEADRELVVRLVREHLTLVELATRRDPDDPATAAALVGAVDGDVATLDLLRALTEADATAAGPMAWSDWRSGLVARLYAACRASLVANQPAAPGPVSEPAAASRVPPDVAATIRAGRPLVRVHLLDGAHRVEIIDRDRAGLFADTAGLLTAHGYVVRSAFLRTEPVRPPVERPTLEPPAVECTALEGELAVGEWWLDAPGGDRPRPELIARDLTRIASGDRTPLGRSPRRRPGAAVRSAAPGSPDSSRALVLPRASDTATVIEVRTTDRPGLLHDLGRALAEAAVAVRSAHVATYAAQAVDTFYLTEASDGSRLAPARVAHVVAVLIDACAPT